MKTFSKFSLLFVFILSSFLFIPKSIAQQYKVTGTTSIRDAPKPSGKSLTTISYEMVTVLGLEGNYYFVKYKDIEGYINKFYLKNVNLSKIETHEFEKLTESIFVTIHSKYHGIFSNGVGVYKWSDRVNAIGKIIPGDTIEILGYKKQ